MTKIYTERLTLDPEEPHPFRAHVYTGRSDHHGAGATEAEALLNAALHWCDYERAVLRATLTRPTLSPIDPSLTSSK